MKYNKENLFSNFLLLSHKTKHNIYYTFLLNDILLIYFGCNSYEI